MCTEDTNQNGTHGEISTGNQYPLQVFLTCMAVDLNQYFN
jgi:hypothetical protein